MYAVGVRFNVCTVGHVSVQDPRRLLKSLAVLWSHWLPTGPVGMAGLSTISVTSSASSWFSSSFTLEHWLQSFEPLVFISFLEVEDLWEAFLATFSWMCLFTLTVPWPPWHFSWILVDRRSYLFILGIWSWLFHNCSRVLWHPSHFSHFEGSQWSAPEPLSTPIYTPPQGATPLCFMRSASHFAS